MEFEDNLILSSDEIDTLNLFGDTENSSEENSDTTPEDKEKDNPSTEEEVDAENLFNPESVSDEDKKEKEEVETPESKDAEGTSPNSDFYCSIAKALVDDGVLPDLDEDTIKGITSPEDLAAAIDKQVNARLDLKQQRINEALEANVEPNVIKQYESVINNLSSISEEAIKEENEKGEQLRKNLIMQDFINKGFSRERAEREVKKSFNGGSDIEDALDALESNKKFFTDQYDELIAQGKKERLAAEKKDKQEAATLKKEMLEDKEIFKGLTLDKNTRQKAYDNIAKAVYKTDDGEYLTAVQKYEMENPVEFRKKLGLLFTLTDGFSNIDNLIKDKVKKQVNSSLRELEHTLKGNSKFAGNPKYMGGSYGSNSFVKSGWSLDA